MVAQAWREILNELVALRRMSLKDSLHIFTKQDRLYALSALFLLCALSMMLFK